MRAPADASGVTDAARASQQFFADKAAAYRASASHGNAAELARMVAWTGARAGLRALDVATGGGQTAVALAGAGCDVVATDATLPMVRALDAGMRRAVCVAESLPFRRSTFDVVTSRIAPHHFPDLRIFAQECARVLRPGGNLYVFDLTTPEEPAIAAQIDHLERLRDPSHGHSWSSREWLSALHDAGLVVARLQSTASEFELEPWIARAKMPPEREAELRRILESPASARGGYGVTPEGKMRVLRVELLARAV